MKLLWLAVLILAGIGATAIGSTDLTFFEMSTLQKEIFWSLRVPRVVFAITVGAMLGLSGSIYQLVLRNPLADSFTTGTASASALGAVLAIATGFPVFLVAPTALITGLSGLMIVYNLSAGSRGMNPVTMILAGVVLNIVASAIIGFTKFFFEDSLTSIVFWLMGGFYQVSWSNVGTAVAVLLVVFVYFRWRAIPLNLLALDEHSAQTSGIDVKKERFIAFFASTLLVAVSVSYTGLIGFVGLIVPHVARSFYGSDMRSGIFYSSVFGAILLVLSDAVARSIIPEGAELPVGIITAISGGGFFLYILKRKRSEIWYD